MKKVTKKAVREYLRKKLSTDETWATRCLVVIYGRQTKGEQTIQDTREPNGVGFTGIDGNILSSFAEFYQRNNYLSPKQMKILLKKAKKYWKQILEICDLEDIVKCMKKDGILT